MLDSSTKETESAWDYDDREEKAETAQTGRSDLEAAGVFVWLKTCFPFAFEEEFSADQKRFRELWFSIRLARKNNRWLKIN